MKLTQTKVKQKPSKFYPGKPYVLYLDDYGPIGDKLNMGESKTGVRFPLRAAERFSTLSKAKEELEKFLVYVNAKIKDAKSRKDHPCRRWE